MKKTRTKSYKFLLPENVAERLQQWCQENSSYKKPEVEYFKYLFIIDTITKHFHSNYLVHLPSLDISNEEYSGCPLNIKILASILGVNNAAVCKMLKNLIDLGFIMRVGGYVVGSKSYRYVLASMPGEFTSVTPLPNYTCSLFKRIAKKNELIGEHGNQKVGMYKRALRDISLEIPEENEYYGYLKSDTDVQDATPSVLFSTPMDLYSKPMVLEEKSSLFSSSSFYEYSSILSSPSLYSLSLSSSSPFFLYSSSSPIYSSPMMGKNANQALELYTSLTSVTLNNKIYESYTLKYVSVKRVDSNIMSLQAILNGEWFAHRPDKKSRVHSNLTNLKRTYRPLLRYDGKPFVELDIRNSQPLIASILIQEYWAKQHKTILADVIQYQRDCEAGTFYDYFMELNNVAQENRREFKIQMFGEVFFSKVTKRITKLKKQFIAKYPHVYTAICDIKGGIGSETYNRFAILLQQREASIIFDNVNIGLLREGIPAFNIFDSILCLPEHKEFVKQRLLGAFSVFNITPSINYK